MLRSAVLAVLLRVPAAAAPFVSLAVPVPGVAVPYIPVFLLGVVMVPLVVCVDEGELAERSLPAQPTIRKSAAGAARKLSFIMTIVLLFNWNDRVAVVGHGAVRSTAGQHAPTFANLVPPSPLW